MSISLVEWKPIPEFDPRANLQFSSWEAPIFKPIPIFQFSSSNFPIFIPKPAFPTLKGHKFSPSQTSHNFSNARVNSTLCENFAHPLEVYETRTPPLQRKPRLQSQESPPEHLRIHSLSLLPPGALDPACPLRATPIADRETFMSRLPYYQEVSLPPFYYLLLLEHWGQCSS